VAAAIVENCGSSAAAEKVRRFCDPPAGALSGVTAGAPVGALDDDPAAAPLLGSMTVTVFVGTEAPVVGTLEAPLLAGTGL
jgi:hypothetical protein